MENEQKRTYCSDYHLLIPIPLREKMDVLAAATGRTVRDLILSAIEQTYFSGAPAVIEPPAKGE